MGKARSFQKEPASNREPSRPLETNRGEGDQYQGASLALDLAVWKHIANVLRICKGNRSKAARLLGQRRSTLQRRLAKNPPAGFDPREIPEAQGRPVRGTPS